MAGLRDTAMAVSQCPQALSAIVRETYVMRHLTSHQPSRQS